MGQKPREQNATNVVKRDENRRDFKGGAIRRLVRDEGVAGSNPATPTKYPLATLNFHNYPQRLPISKRRAQRRTQTRVADGWTLAAAPKRLLRPTEGDDSPDNYVSDPASSDPNRRDRVRVYIAAATRSASLLRA